MLRFARLITGKSTPTLTLFHNTNSRLSLHLLERLAIHDSRYLLDVRTNKLPLYKTYAFIHEECMNVHPQNNRSFERIFPALLASPTHLFCNAEVKRGAKQKQFVPDLELVDESSYLDKVALHAPEELSPFVVDWANKLVAVDDDGLDTIMRNYYSCGMQKSSKVHLPQGNDFIVSHPKPAPVAAQPKPAPAASTSTYNSIRCVHPHIAEFADLY